MDDLLDLDWNFSASSEQAKQNTQGSHTPPLSLSGMSSTSASIKFHGPLTTPPTMTTQPTSIPSGITTDSYQMLDNPNKLKWNQTQKKPSGSVLTCLNSKNQKCNKPVDDFSGLLELQTSSKLGHGSATAKLSLKEQQIILQQEQQANSAGLNLLECSTSRISSPNLSNIATGCRISNSSPIGTVDVNEDAHPSGFRDLNFKMLPYRTPSLENSQILNLDCNELPEPPLSPILPGLQPCVSIFPRSNNIENQAHVKEDDIIRSKGLQNIAKASSLRQLIETNLLDENCPSSTHTKSHNVASSHPDDDILGVLSRPVSEFVVSLDQKNKLEDVNKSSSPTVFELSLQELLDMGFAENVSREALNQTKNYDVRSAIDILLNKAHAESMEESQKKNKMIDESHKCSSPGFGDVVATDDNSGSRRDKGHGFIKSVNSFWSSSQKKVQNVLVELYNTDDLRSTSMSNTVTHPKWAKESLDFALAESKSKSQCDQSRGNDFEFLTEEAKMLELHSANGKNVSNGSTIPSIKSPIKQGRNSTPKIYRDNLGSCMNTRDKFNSRHALQNKNSSCSSATPSQAYDSVCTKKDQQQTEKPSTQECSKGMIRRYEGREINTSRLSSFEAYWKAGNEAFKRGDFVVANEAFSQALAELPQKHPTRIVILCNRAASWLKLGNAKEALADSETVLQCIGSGKGVGEYIEMARFEDEQEGRVVRRNERLNMFYAKAVIRKAQSLELLEKWNEAVETWSTAVLDGIGGELGLRGRDRCQKAVQAHKNGVYLKCDSNVRKEELNKYSNIREGNIGYTSGIIHAGKKEYNIDASYAVQKLRMTQKHLQEEEEEKFEVQENMDRRIMGWTNGRSDNLRGLLSSLDVAFEGFTQNDHGEQMNKMATPNTIKMSDLVVPEKVKTAYMAAIAKIHPDKVSVNASTEYRMTCAAVFSVLNKAWAKFRVENNV